MLDRREELVKQMIVKKPRDRRVVIALVAAAGVMAGGAALGIEKLRNQAPEPTKPFDSVAKIRVHLAPNVNAELYIDGEKIGAVKDSFETPTVSGKRTIKLLGPNGGKCEQTLELSPGKTTTLECLFAGPPKVTQGPRLASKQLVSWSYKSAPLQGVLAMAAKGCGFNVVLPDHIQAKVNAQLTQAPCDQAVESILEAEGLWYDFDPATKLLRIAPRRQIEQERAEAASRPASKYERLPASQHLVDLDFKDVPIHDLAAMLTTGAGKMNFVFPDSVQAKTSITLKGVPWERAFEAVLESHGLWYRYREEGKIVRIAPRRQLEQEEAEER